MFLWFVYSNFLSGSLDLYESMISIYYEHWLDTINICLLHFICQVAGPQMPTNVTPLLKYGTNLLQAVGRFNGKLV